MADGHFPTLVSKDRDANALGNPIFIELSDGTNALHKVVDSAAGGTDAGIAALAVRDDALTTLTPADGDYVPLRTTSTGALWVELTNSSSGVQYDEDTAAGDGDTGTLALVVRKDAIASNVDTDGDYSTLLVDANGRLYVQIHDGGNSITVDATDLDIRDLTSVSDSVEVLQDTHDDLNANANIQVGNADVANGNPVPVSDAGGSLTVDATDLDIRDLTLAADAVKVSGNSTANGPTNPIYVQVVDVGILSNEVHAYNTASSVASDATSNHDYTVAGTTFLLKQIVVSSSGGSKVEVQTGPVASLATIAVGFIPKEGGTLIIPFVPPREVPVTSTGTVRLIRTNRQGASQDLYSTIMGNDVA